MGYAPERWGSSTWHTIHLLCYTAPPVLSATEQLRYTTFFNALPFVLPCATCSEHLQENYKQYPIEQYVGSQASLFEWSVQIHNAVNRILGKPEVSLETAKALWDKKMTMHPGESMANSVDASLGLSSGVYAWVLGVLALMAIGTGIWIWAMASKKKERK